MTESDYNIIKPLQNLPNVSGVDSAKDSARRNKKRNARKRPQQRPDFAEEERDDSAVDNANNDLLKNDTGEHCIDYCA